MRRPERELIRLSSALHPTPGQADYLTQLLSGSTEADCPQAVREGRRRVGHHRPDRVPLDEAIVALDAHHVCVEGCDTPIVADLWALPLGLGRLPVAAGQTRGQSLIDEYLDWCARDAQGDPRALRRVYDLARTWGPLLDRRSSVGQVSVPGERARHATLRRYLGLDGATAWSVTWSLRVEAGWLPQATRADTVGVDVGIHQLVTWASAAEEGRVVAAPLPTGAWSPPAGPSSPLLQARIRRVQFARRAGALDQAIRHLLTYRVLAVEGTHWRGLYGTPELETMALTGVTDLRYWLARLAPLTGSRVVSVPPRGSSRICSCCGQVGHRAATRFRCPACKIDVDVDVNAARNHRRAALRLSWSPGR